MCLMNAESIFAAVFWWKFIVNMLWLSERTKSGLHDLKVVILAWKTKNVLGSQKVWRWRTGSITRWRLLPNTRRVWRIVGSHLTSHLKRLKAAGYIQMQENWVPHRLKPRNVKRRFCMPEMLLERHKKKSLLHRIVTGDETWIHYDNPKRKKSYVKPGQPAKSTAKPSVFGGIRKVCRIMSC